MHSAVSGGTGLSNDDCGATNRSPSSLWSSYSGSDRNRTKRFGYATTASTRPAHNDHAIAEQECNALNRVAGIPPRLSFVRLQSHSFASDHRSTPRRPQGV